MTAPAKLDRIDLKILAELQKNGRITNVDLADAVGLSPSPCLTRVKRLEQAGYITGDHGAGPRRLHDEQRSQLRGTTPCVNDPFRTRPGGIVPLLAVSSSPCSPWSPWRWTSA